MGPEGQLWIVFGRSTVVLGADRSYIAYPRPLWPAFILDASSRSVFHCRHQSVVNQRLTSGSLVGGDETTQSRQMTDAVDSDSVEEA